MCLVGRSGTRLRQVERESLGVAVENTFSLQPRRARLAVPAFELRKQVRQRRVRVGIGDGLCKIVASHGLPIMPFEVKRHALGKPLLAFFIARCADQGLHHANHFRAFFINGHSVEVVNFNVAVRPNGMCHGASIFRELNGSQYTNIFNALDRASALNARHVLAELLVAENSQALFEGKLKPILAGDSIACPIVKILMADDALNVGVVRVGRCSRVGQHIFCVENIEALVFHGAHVEVAGGHNHEPLEVKWQSEAGFIPRHTGHEGVHGVFGFVQIARANKNLQQVFFA